MAQPAAGIAWPFAGRIFRTLGNTVLDRACVCRRIATGVRLTPYFPDILPAKAKLLLEEYREASHRRRHRYPDQPGALLGEVTAPQLTARDGLLLSDWAFLQDPSLVDYFNHPDAWECTLDYNELGRWLASLADRLRAGAVNLSGLMWPLRPQPIEQTITAATLPMWTPDLATDFAALTTDPTTLLCDLRVIETPISPTPSPPASPREEPLAGHRSSDTRPNYARFVPIMRQALERGEAGSVREAARRLVDSGKVPGPASPESKIDRLRALYRKTMGSSE